MILGRQPELGLAELESLYGTGKLRRVGGKAVVVDVDPCQLAFDRLGGSVKFCKILAQQPTADWDKLEKFLLDVSPNHSQTMPEGKMKLGLNAIGFKLSPKKLEVTGLKLKKAIRNTGRSVRLVPADGLELTSAQIIHNQLTSANGWDLQLIKDDQATIIAQTVKVQDIESYTQRDRGRPKRDARVGMLPPKLAQIIINLAAGQLPEDKLTNICEIPAGQPVPRQILGKTVLDPFCGTGVVLQEALLMGYDVCGTDLEPRMIDYSVKNLEWLSDIYKLTTKNYKLAPGDATNHRWDSPIDFVACETYLGRPFTGQPTPEVLDKNITDCNLIIKKFLQNIRGQLKPGTRLCLAVPAWQVSPGRLKQLPLVDSLEEIGYNQVRFEQASGQALIYYRESQVVARHLLVLTTK